MLESLWRAQQDFIRKSQQAPAPPVVQASEEGKGGEEGVVVGASDNESKSSDPTGQPSINRWSSSSS